MFKKPKNNSILEKYQEYLTWKILHKTLRMIKGK